MAEEELEDVVPAEESGGLFYPGDEEEEEEEEEEEDEGVRITELLQALREKRESKKEKLDTEALGEEY